MVALELSTADKCQILDALTIRRDAWQNALEVDEGRAEYCVGFSDPDFSTAKEAIEIINHYNELIRKFEDLPLGGVKFVLAS